MLTETSSLAIETHSLRKEFKTKVAVADLTLSVKRGEIFGFLGPNGAGKTTSVKMLLGLVKPSAGQARVLDAPVGNQDVHADFGFLPEHFRFQDWLSGREFLDIHGRLYGMSQNKLKPRIEELLARVDLLDAGDRKLGEYSKGMLQRIGLAMALLNSPALVFLDEPTSGLDPLGRLLVRDVINDLHAQGTAVFLNSHLLSEVEVTCDRVAFVKNGRVIREIALAQTGTEIEVELQVGKSSPQLLQDLAQFGHNVRPLNGSIHLETDSPARVPEIARWLVGQGIDVYKLGATKPSLETLFLDVMGDDARRGNMTNILTITRLTIHEALRKRILLATLILGLGFLAVFGIGFYFAHGEIQSNGPESLAQKGLVYIFLTMAGLYTVNFLMVMMAALLPVDTLSGEIRSGAIQSLVTKPVRRSDVIFGKWLGFWIILAGYLILMAGGIFLIVRVLGNVTPPNPLIGLSLMMLEATLLLSVSIAGGTRLSTLANGVLVFGLFGISFIGGWIEQIGVLFANETARNIGILTSLLVPSDSLWMLAAYNMQPAIMRDLELTPFSPASVPSNAMIFWASGYFVLVLAIALWQFSKRDL